MAGIAGVKVLICDDIPAVTAALLTLVTTIHWIIADANGKYVIWYS